MEERRRLSDLLRLSWRALAALSCEEEAKITEITQRQLGYPFNLSFTYHDEIRHRPSGKFRWHSLRNSEAEAR